MVQMGLVEVIDRHIVTHGNCRDLSWGWTLVIWLTSSVSTGNHQKLPVREWVSKRLESLSKLSGQAISELDFTDDRLSLLLAHLSGPDIWSAIERDVSTTCIEVYNLDGTTARVDATTLSGHHGAGFLFRFGNSKGDSSLRQIKLMLGSLDPLGFPIASDVVSGEKADDPLYIPCIDRMRATLGKTDLLFVGDCKMGVFETRLHLVGHSQHYLCPLAQVGQTAVDFPDWIKAGVKLDVGDELIKVYGTNKRGESVLLAKGYEFERLQTGELAGQCVDWKERALMIRSMAYMETAQASLTRRLEKAGEALLALTPEPGRGKRSIGDEATLQAKIEGVLKKYRVEGLLKCDYVGEVTQHIRYEGRGRGSANRPQTIEETVRYRMTGVTRHEAAIQEQMDQAGWRVYVTSADKKRLSFENACLAYRQEYRIEQVFHRMKSTLNIEPLYVERDDQVVGMTHFVTLAVRVLVLIEFAVRRSLQKTKTKLVGLHPANPKKGDDKPTAERILKAFDHITLNVFDNGLACLTPLTELQKQILLHLGFDEIIYLNLEKLTNVT